VILSAVRAPVVVLKLGADLKCFKTSLENVYLKHPATAEGW